MPTTLNEHEMKGKNKNKAHLCTKGRRVKKENVQRIERMYIRKENYNFIVINIQFWNTWTAFVSVHSGLYSSFPALYFGGK